MPTLMPLNDGRWEVRCPQCEMSRADDTPIGIGFPIVSRIEAEWIMRNHAGVAPRAEVA